MLEGSLQRYAKQCEKTALKYILKVCLCFARLVLISDFIGTLEDYYSFYGKICCSATIIGQGGSIYISSKWIISTSILKLLKQLPNAKIGDVTKLMSSHLKDVRVFIGKTD